MCAIIPRVIDGACYGTHAYSFIYFRVASQAKSQIGKDFGSYQPSTYQIRVLWLIVRLTQTLQSV